jgi:hypothetical protein
MRLGVAYNFFNSEEHLLASLSSVRNTVDFIVIIYQTVSNAGEGWSDAARDVLEVALTSKLADMAVEYIPDLSLIRQENERQKRKQGLLQCRTARCSHFLSMDADEFYRHSEMENAKLIILQHDLSVTTVSSFFHLKRPIYRALDTTNVPFICKINWFTRIGITKYPVQMVDPTRKIGTFPLRHKHFDSATVAMYHMNFVRMSFTSKLRNTSTTDQNFLNLVDNRIKEWTHPNIFNFPNKGNFDIELVKNEFATFDPIKS